MLLVLSKISKLASRVEYKAISPSHSETVKKAIHILEMIGLVTKLTYTSSYDSPLSTGANERDYRLFLTDLGLFHAQTGTNIPEVIDDNIHYSNDGILGEYFLIVELMKRSPAKAKKHSIFFWENKNNRDGAEIDGLFATPNHLIAIDSKRRKARSSKSLDSYKKRFDGVDTKRRLHLLCLVSSRDEIKFINKHTLNLPFYLTPFLL
jgi:hypothetical protein